MNAPNPSTNNAVPLSDLIEDIAPGITGEWLDNSQIVVYGLATVARPSLDALLNRIRTNLEQWPVERPYLGLYHITDPTNGPTPYLRARFKDIPSWRPDLEPHIALVIHRNFQGQLVQLFARRQGNAVRFFFSREEGLAWLRGFERDQA